MLSSKCNISAVINKKINRICVLLLAVSMHSKGYGFTFFNSHLKAYQMVAGQTTQAFSANLPHICNRTQKGIAQGLVLIVATTYYN